MWPRNRLAKELYQVSHLLGTFRLRSGVTSTEYFDKYRFESDPALLKQIALAMTALIPSDATMLAGLELGGIPLATMLSQETMLPTLFVRKHAKEYGTQRLAEGGNVVGQKVVIIEDVVTSGGQIRQSTAELRRLGALIECAVCVVDREAGASTNLAADDIELCSLFTISALGSAIDVKDL